MCDSNQDGQPICFLNGEFLPFEQARLPVYDLSIVQGATLTERLRTINHEPFQVQEHLRRLQQSLDFVNWSNVPFVDELEKIISEVAQKNAPQLSDEHDLSIVIFITAGLAMGDSNGLAQENQSTVCVYSAPLPHQRWQIGYSTGVPIVIPEIRQVPGNVLDPRIKMRSRLHWSLADQQSRSINPDASALLLDQDGFVTETSSGNLMIIKNSEVFTPLKEKTLNGISQSFVESLCKQLGIKVIRRDLLPSDVETSDEAVLTSSTYCIMPVSSLNSIQIGQQTPGPVTKQIIEQWREEVGFDFVANQAYTKS